MLDSGNSQYLSKTFANAPSSRTTMTISEWVKRGKLGVQQTIYGTPNNYEQLYFTASDTLRIGGPYMSTQQGILETTQVFRDPSAWMHIVAVYDTTNTTPNDRVRLYINGARVTTFSTNTNSNSNNTTTEWGVSGV